MTNFEHIKSMTVNEFFKFLLDINLDGCRCPARDICNEGNSCEDCFIQWLNSEYESDD